MISLVGHQFFMKNRWRFVPCFIFSSRKRWLSCKIYSSRWCKSPFSFRIFVVKGINLRRLSITSMLSSILEIFYYIASGDNLFLMLTNCSCLINNPAKLLDRIFTAYFLFTSINMEWFFFSFQQVSLSTSELSYVSCFQQDRLTSCEQTLPRYCDYNRGKSIFLLLFLKLQLKLLKYRNIFR